MHCAAYHTRKFVCVFTVLINNWLAVQNLRIALKKAVFTLGFKKPSVRDSFMSENDRGFLEA